VEWRREPRQNAHPAIRAHASDLILEVLSDHLPTASFPLLSQLPHKDSVVTTIAILPSFHDSNDSAAATAFLRFPRVCLQLSVNPKPSTFKRTAFSTHHHVSRPRKAIALRELASSQTVRHLLIGNSMAPTITIPSISAST
jgi:hypothetical protein